MEKTKQPLTLIGAVVIVVAAVIVVVVSWVLYEHTVNLLTNNLKERLLSIVTTGATEFDPAELAALKEKEDYLKPEWSKVVNQLIKIRRNNANVLFAYIFKKDPRDPSKTLFIADSHSLNPFAAIDLDNNGIIDDADQLQWPGQPYDEPPEEAAIGYERPITNAEVYQDQWGVEISGYAPIKDSEDNTVAVLAIDIRADDFFTITRQTLYPFLVFIIFLLIILVLLSSVLISIWNRRVELFAELDRQKDELLSIVSHQLATPITSIKWYVEMMLDGDLGKLNSKQEEHVKSMRSIAVDLTDLVSMILDVSRIQLGRMKIEKQKLDLNEFFKEILEVIEPKAKEKGVNFIVSVPKKLPVAMLDKRYTRMTIENLLTNAVKYTPAKGNVSMKVELRGNILYCEVKDTGCGIPKADQDKIFGKLFRASNVRNSIDGNGFGLYVAKGAIEAQAGKIWFESEENRGTSFFIQLPINEKIKPL